ncbi:hypothetical protein VKT23_010908 [Stygiomarasmius scandens]|uniref:Uncharacterized protein n=1 Tax=Marasmiellus scandens TaxID=2682957 RepID=A0ABR1JB64_9AGAR
MSEPQNQRKLHGRPTKPIAQVPNSIPAHIARHISGPLTAQFSKGASEPPNEPSVQLVQPLDPPSNASSISTFPSAPTTSSFLHSQPRLRAPAKSTKDKFTEYFGQIEELLQNWDFESLGDFLQVLFYHHKRGNRQDPCGRSHAQMVSRFLQGGNHLKVSDFIQLLYEHPSSSPRYRSEQQQERELVLQPSPSRPPEYFKYAGPCLFTWAVHTVVRQCHRQIASLARPDAKDPDDAARLRASTNGRSKSTRLVTWNDVISFSVDGLNTRYQSQAPIVYFLMQSMCTKKDRNTGEPIVRIRRPHVPVGTYSHPEGFRY